MNPDEMTAVLATEFPDIGKANEYAQVMKVVARAENAVARAAKARSEAMAQGAGTMPDLSQVAAMLPEGFSVGRGGGGGTRTPRVPVDPTERALRSMRFGAGKLSPLAGQTAEAMLGKDAAAMVFRSAAKLAGPIAVAAAALDLMKKAGEEAYRLADGASRASLALHDIRTVTGGSTADAARLQGMSFLGVSAENAAAFKERISSDPNAMMQASRLGIRQVKGNFGNQNFAVDYLKAIEETAKIADEHERLFRARTLGISPEVERMALLSPATRALMQRSAGTTGRVNNPEAQRAAAEFQAAVDLERQARENMLTAIGQFFGQDIAAFLRTAATVENAIAGALKFNGATLKTLLPSMLSILPGGGAFAGLLGGMNGAGAMARGIDGAVNSDPNAAITANTRATLASVQAMDRLNGSLVGAGQRGSGFFGGMRDTGGAGYHEAVTSRSLAWGTLG
jgi:hypothetical protein